MRLTYISIIVAMAFLGSGGSLFWKEYLLERALELHPQETINKTKADFEAQYKPSLKLNSEEIRQDRESEELLDASSTLPQSAKYTYKEISALYKYSKSCLKKTYPKIQNSLRKAFVWQEFLCGKRKTLPKNFFGTSPFMHPSGESFVAIAARMKSFKNLDWIANNSKYSHVLENLCGNDPKCRGTSAKSLNGIVTADNLRYLFHNDGLVQNSQFVFFAHRLSNSLNAPTVYSAYRRSQWNEFLEKKKLSAYERLSLGCLFQEGNVCWQKNNKNGEEAFYLALLFTLGLLVLASALIIQIIRKAISQRVASKQRTFILQMLTHEIRTPATALQLSLETLRQDFDRLPENSQEAFLRICDQNQRLVRVIEASKQYLINDNSAQSVKFKTQPITSANSLFEILIEKYGSKVVLEKLPEDRAVTLDRYWIELCLTNLIDNALSHGAPPVTVSLFYEDKDLIIEVCDKGNLKVSSMSDLAIPFQKGPSSQGLGLGLVLVQKIANAMNGELTLSCAPTTFSMKIRDLS